MRHIARRSTFILAWLSALLVAAATMQIALQSERFASLAEWLVSLMYCAFIVLVAGGIGRAIVGEREDGATRVALSAGIGLGVLSAATLAFGLMGALRMEAGWALLIVAAVLFARRGPMRAWLSDLAALPGALPRHRLGRWAALYSAFALTLAFLYALAPATAWDALLYHLKGPELYLAAGRIVQSIDLPFINFPQFQEMLFLLARMIGAPNVALMHWVFLAGTALLVYSEARRVRGESSGWMAVAILLSAQSIVSLAGSPYVDLALTFHVMAAFVCLRRWGESGDIAWLRLGGVFAGLAMATKYTSISAVVGLTLLIVFLSVRAKLEVGGWKLEVGGWKLEVGSWRVEGGGWIGSASLLACLGQFGAIAALTVLPWYFKNLVVTGNPIYPFVFGGPGWDPFRAAWFSRPGEGLAATAPLRLLIAPIEVSILAGEGREPYSATIGPLFLMFAPMIFIDGWKRLPQRTRDWLKDASILAGAIYLGWLIVIAVSPTFTQARHLMPIFPYLAVMAAMGLGALRESPSVSASVRRAAALVVAAALALSAFGLALRFGGSHVIEVLSGSQSREDYLTARLGWHIPAMEAVNQLPAGSRVLFLWEPRSLYCRIDCQPDHNLDLWPLARRRLGSVDAIAEAWREEFFTHVLLFRTGYDFVARESSDLTAKDQAALEALIDTRLVRLQDFGGVYELYTWRYGEQ